MKLRLLNASHQALCYPGYLVGYRLVHEVTADPLFARFLLDYMTAEGDLADDPRFTGVYGAILAPLLDQGVRKTLTDLDQYA